MHAKTKTKTAWYRRKIVLWIVGVVVGLVVAVSLAFRLSPWPGALIIRSVFDRGGRQRLASMEAALPNYSVTVLTNQQYHADDKDALLDVYIPSSALQTHAKLPIVVWTHGGAWLSGDKKDDAPYFKRLASKGFIVVAVNYSLAPEKKYPTAVRQLNDAYAYIEANAVRFDGNPDKVVLAGDSAGAQLSSQMAAIMTNPSYAQEMNIKPSLAPSQLAGVVLFCGIYKMESLTEPSPNLPKIIGWGDDVAVWALTGTRDKSSPLIRQMSAYYHAGKDFPATFISGGNGDPLTNAQSVPFAGKLESLNVPVTTLFYPQNHTPSLPHEYQFTFNADGEHAFAAMTQFLQARTE
ncbi:MAG TPA: alpha/beta hydrolase [Candidatus Saccharimonadales bacterium]